MTGDHGINVDLRYSQVGFEIPEQIDAAPGPNRIALSKRTLTQRALCKVLNLDQLSGMTVCIGHSAHLFKEVTGRRVRRFASESFETACEQLRLSTFETHVSLANCCREGYLGEPSFPSSHRDVAAHNRLC
jgi:hypothetical protein